MHTLRIFLFRLLDPLEWVCRRICNVEEIHPEIFVNFFLNGICIFVSLSMEILEFILVIDSM